MAGALQPWSKMSVLAIAVFPAANPNAAAARIAKVKSRFLFIFSP
jgi:hypothetical protein